MGLCSLCETIPFDDLPSMSLEYDVTVLTAQAVLYHEMDSDGGVEQLHKPIGFMYHKSVQELRCAASYCSLCFVVEQGVSQTLAVIEANELKGEITRITDSTLWLISRGSPYDGFVVMSSARDGRVYVLTVMGFYVEDDNPLAGVFPGRLIPKDSRLSVPRALKWLSDCDTSHSDSRCSAYHAPLPKRVLDLEYPDAPDRIRLYETEGEICEYVSLSHAWGNSRHFMTTQENFAAHEKGIWFAELPQTFQDAIIVTRELKIRYLWIDSICIIQDSISDWEQESAKMASVYSNASLVISATGSSGDSDGFFLDRTSPVSCAFEFRRNDGILASVNASLLSKSREFDFGLNSVESDPLSKRGWTLQERFLARRTLHSASDQFYFECGEHFVSEDGHQTKSLFNKIFKNPRIRTQPYPHIMVSTIIDEEEEEEEDEDARDAIREWTDLLSNYTDRQLTKDSDKLVALSGIVEVFKRTIEDEYVAGLWRSRLVEGLLWYHSSPRRIQQHHHPVHYRAPSWSWASVNGRIYHHVWFDDKAVAHVCECQVELKSMNPYGEVVSGRLVIKSLLHELIEIGEPKKDSWVSDSKIGDAAICISFCVDYHIDESELREMSMFALVLSRRDEDSGPSYLGIVITPTLEHEGEFRRVGYFSCNQKREFDISKLMEDESKLVTVTLV